MLGSVFEEIGHAMGHLLDHDVDPVIIAAHDRLFDRLKPYEKQGGRGGKAGRQEMFAGLVRLLLESGMDEAARRYDAEVAAYVAGLLYG